MAWQLCAMAGCSMHIRAGLRRFGEGVDGQSLADGRFCWKCRARQARKGAFVARRHPVAPMEKEKKS